MAVAFPAVWPRDLDPATGEPQETYEDQFSFTLSAGTQNGVDPDSGGLDAAPAGNTITLGPGRLMVGGYAAETTTGLIVPAPANSAASPRAYRLVARLDRAASQVRAVVLEGGAAANPQPPPLSRSATVVDLPLWRWRRDGNGGPITGLTSERVYLNPHGPVVCTSEARPANPRRGEQAYESDTGRIIYWHGGAWRVAVDTEYPTPWQPLPLMSGYRSMGSSGKSPSIRFFAPGLVQIRGTIERTNGEPIPNGAKVARVPAHMRPDAYQRHTAPSAQTSGGNSVRVEVVSTNTAVNLPGEIFVWHPASHNPDWLEFGNMFYDVT